MTTLLDVQGRRVVGYLVNKSGGAVAKGDAVVVDAANDEAFTTSAAGAVVIGVGIVAEENGIASNASGRIVFSGYVDLVNVNASVTRGDYGKTHTVVKQVVDAGASRVLGAFCQFLKSGTTPSAILFGQPDGSTGAGGLTGAVPALTFGTAAAAGSASTGVRTDATLPIFDATVPAAVGAAVAAAAGSAGVAARRDHQHGVQTRHGCLIYRNATETSTTVLHFNAELDDTDGYHDTATNNERITIPTGLGGLYAFEFGTSCGFSSSSANGIRLRKNGSTVISTNWYVDAQGYVRGVAVAVLAAADYVEATNFTGVSVSFGHASAFEAQEHLSAYLIGA